MDINEIEKYWLVYSDDDMETLKKEKPQITQIISALSSWLLALSKQQARRPPLPQPQPEPQPFYFRVSLCNFVANFLVIFIEE